MYYFNAHNVLIMKLVSRTLRKTCRDL